MKRTPTPVAKNLNEANAIIAALWVRVRVQELEAKVEELTALLRQNSSNPSRPPSSDPPWSKPKRKPPEAASGRRPDGQPGHAAHVREPVPADQVDDTRDVYPDRCAICKAELPPDLPAEDGYEHQVTELAAAQARVTAYRLWRKRCPHCGGHTRAKRPAGVPEGAFGPRLKAVISALTARYRVSRREVVEAARDLFGVELSVGAVQAICEEVSETVAPTVALIKAEVEASPAANADETGWRQKGKMHWLWTAATSDSAFFVLAPDRGHPALARLLSESFDGILMSDRWVAYKQFPDERRQFCHGHLRQDFQAAIDRGGQETWSDSLLLATESPDRKLNALGADLWNHWDALWTFVHVDGVEPTNNLAERTLRPAVLWRKSSFGTQSDAGSLFVSRMLTVTQTARRRGVRLLDWLHKACSASAIGLDPPPLLAV